MCIDWILFGFGERWCCFQCVLSSHLEWANQEASKISEEAAALKVPQANVHCVCIVLIGFGSAADFIQSFEKDRKSGD